MLNKIAFPQAWFSIYTMTEQEGGIRDSVGSARKHKRTTVMLNKVAFSQAWFSIYTMTEQEGGTRVRDKR